MRCIAHPRDSSQKWSAILLATYAFDALHPELALGVERCAEDLSAHKRRPEVEAKFKELHKEVEALKGGSLLHWLVVQETAIEQMKVFSKELTAGEQLALQYMEASVKAADCPLVRGLADLLEGRSLLQHTSSPIQMNFPNALTMMHRPIGERDSTFGFIQVIVCDAISRRDLLLRILRPERTIADARMITAHVMALTRYQLETTMRDEQRVEDREAIQKAVDAFIIKKLKPAALRSVALPQALGILLAFSNFVVNPFWADYVHKKALPVLLIGMTRGGFQSEEEMTDVLQSVDRPVLKKYLLESIKACIDDVFENPFTRSEEVLHLLNHLKQYAKGKKSLDISPRKFIYLRRLLGGDYDMWYPVIHEGFEGALGRIYRK